MKKVLILFLIAFLLLGCHKEIDKCNKITDNFLISLKDGNYEEANSYLSSDAKDYMDNFIGDINKVFKVFDERIGDDAKDTINKIKTIITKNVFHDYHIENTSLENDEYVVDVKIETIKNDEVIKIYQNVIKDDYVVQNAERIVDAINGVGDENSNKEVMINFLNHIYNLLENNLIDISYEKKDLRIKLNKYDDNYLITEMEVKNGN